MGKKGCAVLMFSGLAGVLCNGGRYVVGDASLKHQQRLKKCKDLYRRSVVAYPYPTRQTAHNIVNR